MALCAPVFCSDFERRWLVGGLEGRKLVSEVAKPALAEFEASMELEELPYQVLDSLLLQLELKDRFRLLACSKRLHRFSAASLCLWHDAALHLASPRQALQLAASLAAARPARLRRLQLTQRPGASKPAVADKAGAAEARGQQAATEALAAALAGVRSLESLTWTLCGDPGRQLGAWAAALPRLHTLTLTCQGAPLTLPPEFGGLQSLERLTIYEDVAVTEQGSALTLGPGCLPPSLRQLDLFAAGLLGLPPSLSHGAAAGLTRLRLSNGGERMSLRGLAGLCGLRELALLDFWPSGEVLEEVAALPGLTLLDFSCCRPGASWAGRQERHPGMVRQCLEGLAQVEGLQEVRLGDWGLRSLPPELLAMPRLKSLHLEGSPALRLEPAPLGIPRSGITELSMDAAAALDSLAGLRDLPALRTLRLSNITSCGVPWRQSAVGRVWGALDDAGVTCLRQVIAGPGPSEEERAKQAARLDKVAPATNWV